MRCYIMRHTTGKPYHRNTIHKQNKARAAGGLGKKALGLEYAYGQRNDSFILYTAACIATWNEEGSISRGKILCRTEPPFRQRCYPPAGKDLKNQLRESGFPPPLLTVCACDIMPMNQWKAKKVDMATARELAAQRDGLLRTAVIDDDQITSATSVKTRNFTDLTARPGNSEREDRHNHQRFVESIDDPYTPDMPEIVDTLNGWMEPGEREADQQPASAEAAKRPPYQAGTKVQNIDFIGGWIISRRMASYWRGTASETRRDEYERCCRFIVSKLTKREAFLPSHEGAALTGGMGSAVMMIQCEKDMRERQLKTTPQSSTKSL